MDWISVKIEKPEQFAEVVVCSYVAPYCPSFFVATYCRVNKEWLMHQAFKGPNSPYMKIIVKVQRDDVWCYIEHPEISEDDDI